MDNKSVALLGGGVLVGYGASQYLGNKKGIGTWGSILAGLGIIGYSLYTNKGLIIEKKTYLPQMTAGDILVESNYTMPMDSTGYIDNVSGNASPGTDRNHIYPGMI